MSEPHPRYPIPDTLISSHCQEGTCRDHFSRFFGAVFVGRDHQFGIISEVFVRWRRGGLPLEGESAPGVAGGNLAFEDAPDGVEQEGKGGDCQDIGADRADQVQRGELGIVLGDAAIHPFQAQLVHRQEAEIEADERQGEVNSAQGFVHHASGHFGEPVVDSSVDAEDATAKQDVVQVRHDEVGVVNVDVEGDGGNHHATDPTNHEHGDEADRKQHGAVEAQFAAPDRCHPAKHFDPGRYGDDHGVDHEEHPQPGGCAAGEHVVRPDDQTEETDGKTGVGDRLVAKNRLA